MSTWTVEDFDAIFTQEFTVFEKMVLNKFFFKLMKKGTINSGATFTFRLLDGSTTLFTENLSADQVNATSSDSYISNFSVSCPGLVLNTNADGTSKTYEWSFSSSGYVPTTDINSVPVNNSLGMCKRQGDDSEINITGNYPVAEPRQQALIQPYFIEYEVLV